MGKGVDVSGGMDESVRKYCIDVKSNRSPIPKYGDFPWSSSPLELVHSDVCGAMQVESMGFKVLHYVHR